MGHKLIPVPEQMKHILRIHILIEPKAGYSLHKWNLPVAFGVIPGGKEGENYQLGTANMRVR